MLFLHFNSLKSFHAITMNKLLLLFVLLPSILISQNPVKINLLFESEAPDSCQLYVNYYAIEEYNTTISSKVFEGECKFSIPSESKTSASLHYKKKQINLYLEPGDAITIKIGKDTSQHGFVFSGQGAQQNAFLTSFYSEFKSNFDKELVKQKMVSTPIDAYEMYLFRERRKQLEFYNKQDQSSFSNGFKNFLEQTIRYCYFSSLISYPIVNANQANTILRVNALPEVMLDGLSSKLFDDGALINSQYCDFITNYIVYFTSKANDFNKFTDYNISIEKKVTTAKKELNGKTQVWYIANFLNSECDKLSSFTVKHVYAELKNIEHDGTYSQLTKNKCEARIKAKAVTSIEKTKTQKDVKNENTKNPFDGLTLKDINGKTFNPKSIEDKVVFVDFWASWCGPCRQEFPASKALHERFTEKQLKNIVFLYISIDGNEGSWRNAVNQIGMKGLLLHSPGDWSSPIVNYFGINSIPRYMLIDKTGKIIDTNAPRPSSGDVIYNAIMKLLN